MNFASCQDLTCDVLELVPYCAERRVSAIYGVPRSGMLPATILATALHLPLGMAGGQARTGRRVDAAPLHLDGPALLIDDSVNHGGSMKTARAAMVGMNFVTAAVYMTPGSERLVDTFVRHLPGPRVFQWNLFHCQKTPQIMFDLDGVFCFDPTVHDDDGPEYQAALREALPKRTATWPVGWITTNRIERWRGITLDWLSRHRIEVANDVLMQPYETASERRAATTPAAFKAQCYCEARGCLLFVESHQSQAVEIARLSGRPVLALDTMRLCK